MKRAAVVFTVLYRCLVLLGISVLIAYAYNIVTRLEGASAGIRAISYDVQELKRIHRWADSWGDPTDSNDFQRPLFRENVR